ncbi:MAG: hypothetical protein LJE97_05010 [Betaproteobacteria bacterium]|jgi:hypothetical protein|nr:hypothetical protein [Betaproteobacteria bacterium]
MKFLYADFRIETMRRVVLAGCMAVALMADAPAGAAESPAADSPLKLVGSWKLTKQDLDVADGPPATHRLRLEMAMMRAAGWSSEQILDATKRAVRILAQCGIRTTFVALYEFDGPARYRYLATPVSRDLARRVRLARPAVFFVADTLNQPAFDAEAIGRANSRSRPEMTDTVWITAGTRDLANVMAHELAHVLADSGEHSDLPGNLMREETAAESTSLTSSQCRRVTENGTANGLLQAEKP